MVAPDSPVRGKPTGDTCSVCGINNCDCTPSLQFRDSTIKEKCRWCNQSNCLCQGIARDERGHPADYSDDQLIGQVIRNHYEILEVIGRGGMGTVYKVRHRNLKREYALKMIHHHKRGV